MTETHEVFSVACRGSMNERSAKCFQGGGWLVDALPASCPHCGKAMFLTATITTIDIGGT